MLEVHGRASRKSGATAAWLTKVLVHAPARGRFASCSVTIAVTHSAPGRRADARAALARAQNPRLDARSAPEGAARPAPGVVIAPA